MRGGAYREVIDHLDKLRCEASYRTQVGRLYYAAYTDVRHACVEYYGYTVTRGPGDHEGLRAFLRNRLNQALLFQLLAELHDDRKLADYRDDRVFTPSDLNVARGRADRIYTLLEKQLHGRTFTP